MAQPTFTDYFLHTPAQVATNYVKWAEWMHTAPVIDYGCILDKFVIPMRPGDMMAIVARPGHCKSSWMAYLAKRTAMQLVARGEKNKCVIYVSWEQPVEQIEAFFETGDYTASDLAWGRADIDSVKRQATKRANLPVWFIGYSAVNAGKKCPQMRIETVYESIRQIRYEYEIEPALLCLDYLQIIPVQAKRSRVEEVTEATIEAKQLGMELGIPILAGVQASRRADSNKLDMPTMGDAQWSSAIEQYADKQIALLRPSKVVEAGETMDIGGHDLIIEQFTLLIKLLKQRGDEGSGIWAVHFEPHTLQLYDYDFHNLKD